MGRAGHWAQACHLAVKGVPPRLEFPNLRDERRGIAAIFDGHDEARYSLFNLLPLVAQPLLMLGGVVALREVNDLFDGFGRERVFLDGLQYRFVDLGYGHVQRVGAGASVSMTAADIFAYPAALARARFHD